MEELSKHQIRNLRKDTILGMNHSTARNRLAKQLLFKYVKLAGDDICYQCKERIGTVEELSIEHKIPWLKGGKDMFWDLENISFSHLKCNVLAGERINKGIKSHPSTQSYKEGCRCDECKEIQKLRQREFRQKSSLL